MSNHLGDTNKMVSDTPRTEAEVNRQKCWSDDLITIDANFACQLERELNAANDRIKRLEEFVEQLTNPKFTRDDLPKEALLQRIKRLEEAGDRMADVLTWSAAIQYKRSPTVAAWRKAKEAKP